MWGGVGLALGKGMLNLKKGKPVGVWGGRDTSTAFKFIRNFCLGHMETGRKQREGIVFGISLTSSFP